VSFLVPAGFALAALSAPIIVLYMLRSRRTRTRVSSTLLWANVSPNVSSNAPWQPLRFSWLLFLQLLALLLLTLAVARPARATSTPLAAHTVLVVDTSASMQADDGGHTRLESAKRKAIDVIARLGPGQRMSVVDGGPAPRVVLPASTDRTGLVDAVESLRATDGVCDAPSE
jgi:Ca-activated chloride channel homolog